MKTYGKQRTAHVNWRRFLPFWRACLADDLVFPRPLAPEPCFFPGSVEIGLAELFSSIDEGRLSPRSCAGCGPDDSLLAGLAG